MKTVRGFTLLEVLVALAVIAIALASIIKVVGTGASNAGYLRDKTFAHWIAANRLAQMQIRNNAWPTLGTEDGKAKIAGRQWYWRTVTKNTPEPDMRRVDIEVRMEDDDDVPPLTTLTGFIAKPTTGARVGIGIPPSGGGSPSAGTGTNVANPSTRSEN
ncbi:MAG: type II secretion system minor pseudopilin GspI [Pseudomonadota bacterium]|nr:type II secretion system minor pseudopilin GspI [Pseudomonadota bacterium]